MLTQNPTQFRLTPGLGQPTKGVQPGVFSAKINPSSVATGIQVGSPMKLVAVAGSPEVMIDLAGATDEIFGVIPLIPLKNSYLPGNVTEIFTDGCTLLLEATAAINAGALLAIGATSAAGGGPGVTTTTTPGAQFGGIALTSVAAGATAVVVKIKSGTVPAITAWTAGTAILSGGTIAVAQTNVTANSLILLTTKTVGGTQGALYVSAITAGTGFTITSTSGTDTSTVNYAVVN